MIAFLRGRVLEQIGQRELILAVGDVGYRVAVGPIEYEHPHELDNLELWIHPITGEAGTKLYGFLTRDERDRFVELLAVEGVGGKTAMSIVAAGVNPRDVAQLVAVKGVGKKTADKIVEHFGAAA